jgi:hypothetical protein
MRLIEQVFDFVPREVTPDDIGFILNSFERSLRPEFRDATSKDFSAAAKAFLNREIAKGASIVVASPPNDPHTIWAWMMVDSFRVLYCFVLPKFRCARICTRLLDHLGIDRSQPIPVAFMTDLARKVSYQSSLRLRHCPTL